VLLEVVAIIGEQMGASVLKNVVQVCNSTAVILILMLQKGLHITKNIAYS
jgi:hypothetical protein